MKIKRFLTITLSLILAFAFSSCTSASVKTKMVMEIEMTENYDNNDPFINEKLIYVSEDIESLDLDITFQMKGESGLLEIADNETGEVFWSEKWNENVDKTSFTISIDNLETEREYVVRFTGTKINYAKIVITSESSLVKERVKP